MAPGRQGRPVTSVVGVQEGGCVGNAVISRPEEPARTKIELEDDSATICGGYLAVVYNDNSLYLRESTGVAGSGHHVAAVEDRCQGCAFGYLLKMTW